MYSCSDCSITVTKKNRRCRSCAARLRWKTREISRPCVLYDGIRYYKQNPVDGNWRAGNTFGGELLHRAVWLRERGPISDGWHIHHKDKNQDNNKIDNLEPLAPSAHSAHHYKEKIPLHLFKVPKSFVCNWCKNRFTSTAARPKYCCRQCKLEFRYELAREEKRESQAAPVIP